MSMNYDGTVHADTVYTEAQLLRVLGISREQMIEYYKMGLLFFQRTRQEQRQVVGAEYHRFMERNSKRWAESENAG